MSEEGGRKLEIVRIDDETGVVSTITTVREKPGETISYREVEDDE